MNAEQNGKWAERLNEAIQERRFCLSFGGAMVTLGGCLLAGFGYLLDTALALFGAAFVTIGFFWLRRGLNVTVDDQGGQ